jgi:hypothetical protein
MTYEPDAEPSNGSELSVRRPAVYPVFQVPLRIANLAGIALVGSAALIMIAALIEALSYRRPSLSQAGLLGPAGSQFGQQVAGFSDRLALFTNAGANLDVALLLVVSTAVIAMAASGPQTDEEWLGWWRVVIVAAAVLAAFVALANLTMCVEVIRNASGEFIAEDSANKLSSVVGFLAPVALSTGVLLYTVYRLRSSTPPEDDPGEPDTDGTGSPTPHLTT